jgi:CheY-like chemotaxis protein
MAKESILFVDNDPDFLATRSEFLKKEGYRVIQADGPSACRKRVREGGIAAIIIDIRLMDDADEQDTSGLALAKEIPSVIPKIMLTSFPSAEKAREALGRQVDGLPAAIEFVVKEEGPEALVQAVRRSIDSGAEWLHRVREAIDGTDRELEEDHDSAQRQSKANFWASLGVALTGMIFIFFGMALVFSGHLEIGVAGTVAGLVTEAISYLFFLRTDAANERMDRYHSERVEGQRFKTLLQACEGLDSDKQRERCQEQVISAAILSWLGGSEPSASGVTDGGQDDSEGQG